jgi:hypothetical protein
MTVKATGPRNLCKRYETPQLHCFCGGNIERLAIGDVGKVHAFRIIIRRKMVARNVFI